MNPIKIIFFLEKQIIKVQWFDRDIMCLPSQIS